MDASLVVELRAVARELRQLAYTGHWDKEGELLALANRVNERAQSLEEVVFHS